MIFFNTLSIVEKSTSPGFWETRHEKSESLCLSYQRRGIIDSERGAIARAASTFDETVEGGRHHAGISSRFWQLGNSFFFEIFLERVGLERVNCGVVGWSA